MNILAVIPARGGSKGIPRKNIRLMAGKPLIYYAINNVKQCKQITDIVVSTDDDEISEIAQYYGVETIRRNSELAMDNITLDPVIYDAVNRMEEKKGIRYDVVITFQPTSPLLKAETISQAIDEFINKEHDTCISVINEPHLAWKQQNNEYIPAYEKRLNRQQLPAYYKETGGFLITRREFVIPNSRLGEDISVYEITSEEGIDIDSDKDWLVCEAVLSKKKILFRTDGHKELGMGHIYRTLTLALSLIGHDILIVLNEDCRQGIEKIKQYFLPYKVIKNEEEIVEVIDGYKPDIFVYDLLDSEKEYIQDLKQKVNRVVSFEDLGSGNQYTDATINALYEGKNNLDNVYSGYEYVCLRDEFLVEHKKIFSDKVKNILVVFGGTDPANLTQRLYRICKSLVKDYPDIVFNFVIGIGYDNATNEIKDSENIVVYEDIKSMATLMNKADLAITSQGRTVFELASLGVPSIVVAQNTREQLHTFAEMRNGFVNLGLYSEIDNQTIIKTLEWLINTPKVRRDMHNLMLKKDLTKGISRVKEIILGND